MLHLMQTENAPRVSFERATLPATQCPGCAHRGLTQFYHVTSMPVHSCLLMETREEALAHPRGELQLALCPKCGLISNVAYNPADHHYSDRYEETQGFSPTFNAFARELVRELVETYSLRGKTVLEIGCGKGEFLGQLCREGNCRGIGVDPGFIPGRLPPDLERNLSVHRELFGPQHFDPAPDLVCCRHTLEHIHHVREFLQMVREGIGTRLHTNVFFDLPDTMRILREGAFWDCYYEHCSYFTLGSLARAFRAARFDVSQLSIDYDGQWLMLHAVPTEQPTTPALPEEEDLTEIQRSVEAFGETGLQSLIRWQSTIQQIADDGGRAVVWGSGSKGVAFLVTLGISDQIEYVVDINPLKHGRFMPGTGHPIVGPEFLQTYRPTHVIVMNPIYCDEISRDLDRLSLAPEILAV